MPVSRATHAFASAPGGAYSRVVITGTFTTSTGVVSSVVAPPGFSLGNFTSGVATLTIPKSLGHLSGRGYFDVDSSTAANRRSLLVNTVAISSGTANVRLVKDSDGTTDTTHTIGTGAFYLTLDVTD
jgi:hypothetical protein